MNELDKLPFLVTRKVFLTTAGISARTLRTLVESGVVRRWVPQRPQRLLLKGLYYRDDLKKMVGSP